MLVKAEESLARLPPQLDSPTARRMEFEKCTEQVRDLVQNAANDYSTDEFFQEKSNRWRACVAESLSGFRRKIHKLVRDAINPAIMADKEQAQLKEGDKVYTLGDDDFTCCESTWVKEDVGQSYNNVINDSSVKAHKDNVMKSLRDYRGSALPGFLSFSVFVQFFNNTVASKWAGPAMEMLEDIKKDGVEMVERAIQAKCTTPSLAAFMQHAFWIGLQSVAKNAEQAVRALLKDESLPSTQNHYFFENVQKLRYAPMTNAIKEA